METKPTNEELDFGDLGSEPEQTLEPSDTPGDNTEEQGENVENQTESEAVSDGEENANLPEETQADDEALTHFLKSKGIDTEKPENITRDTLYKLGKMAYNSEKQYKQGTQELAEMRKQLEAAQNQPHNAGENSENGGRTAEAALNAEVADFVSSKKLTEDEEQKMMDWLAQPVLDRQTGKPLVDARTGNIIMRAHQLLYGTFTLEDAYNASGVAAERIRAEETAKSEQAKALQEQKIAEERKAIEARQIAKRPSSAATNSTQFVNEKDQSASFMAGFLGSN